MANILTTTDGGVTTITLNRPEKLNAFYGTMREELLATLRVAGSDTNTRVVVLTGSGRGFCAGGDVEYMSGLQATGDITSFRRLLDAGRDIIATIVTMSKPVIAAINGVAAGAGCNLALACDYRIAADTARLGETFVRIGLHPDWGGTWLLPRLVGRSRAVEIMMTGRMVEAQEALAIGMVDRLASGETLMTEAMNVAQMIAAGPPLAIAGIKRAVLASESNGVAAQIELESEIQLEAFGSSDAAEGMRAFFEKRTPSFRGE